MGISSEAAAGVSLGSMLVLVEADADGASTAWLAAGSLVSIEPQLGTAWLVGADGASTA